MSYLAIIISVLFSVKILWNLTIPYTMATCPAIDGARTRGISLMPYLEVALLGVVVGLAALKTDSRWPWDAGRTAWFGLAIIVASYVHLVAAGAIVGWITSKRLRRT